MALLNGSYEQVWTETVRAVETVAGDAAPLILGGTPDRLYRLYDVMIPMTPTDFGVPDGRSH